MKIFSFLLIILLPSSFILEAKPNFILTLSDDLGYGDLSCYNFSITGLNLVTFRNDPDIALHTLWQGVGLRPRYKDD